MTSVSASNKAVISKKNWDAFTFFLRQSLDEKNPDSPSRMYIDSDSEIFFNTYFIETTYLGESSVPTYGLSKQGRDVLSYARNVAAELIGIETPTELKQTISNFKNSEDAMVYIRSLHANLCSKLKTDVELFKTYDNPDPGQKSMINVFSDVIPYGISNFFSVLLLLHMGRLLGFQQLPRSGSFRLAADSFFLRCLCEVAYQGLIDPTNFPCKLPGLTEQSYSDSENIQDEDDFKASSDSSSKVWDNKSVSARTFRMFLLRQWFNFISGNKAVHEYEFTQGSCLTEAIKEYNNTISTYSNGSNDGKTLLPITNELKESAVKDLAIYWLGKITNIGKQPCGFNPAPTEPSTTPIEDWCPTNGVSKRRESWDKYYCYAVANCKSSQLPKMHPPMQAKERKRIAEANPDQPLTKQAKKMAKVADCKFCDVQFVNSNSVNGANDIITTVPENSSTLVVTTAKDKPSTVRSILDKVNKTLEEFENLKQDILDADSKRNEELTAQFDEIRSMVKEGNATQLAEIKSFVAQILSNNVGK